MRGVSLKKEREGRYHQRLEKSTSMQNDLALNLSDQIHRKDPKSYLKLKAVVADVLKDQQHIPSSLRIKRAG